MPTKTNTFLTILNEDTEAAPLAVFRIFFGLLVLVGMGRFWYYGWIEKFYIEPFFFFSYRGFGWVKPIGEWTYLLFGICALAAFFVMIGWKYRWAAVTLFLSFTYIELMDKTNYLNHYYAVSLMSFLLIFLPANAYYSVDARLNSEKRFQYVPGWSILVIQFMLCIIYFYAGLAKLNSDWLLEAQPLSIWLMGKYDVWLIGDLLQQKWTHYAFSYAGAVYDLGIPFLLMIPTTRNWAFVAVIVFHYLTWVLFPIGIFPFVMIFSGFIFLSPRVHHFILNSISQVLFIGKNIFDNGRKKVFAKGKRKALAYLFGAFFIIQILLPFRYLMYPGELFWTEEGFRFSWRVMLMEKAGYANFKIVDGDTGKQFYIQTGNFLNPRQEKQMATQPDFILEFAHYLAKYYELMGVGDPQIFVESYVALNGRSSRPFVNPNIDLTKVSQGDLRETWILPFDEEIKGF